MKSDGGADGTEAVPPGLVGCRNHRMILQMHMLFDADFACGANAVARAGTLKLEGQGVVKVRYEVGGKTYENHYLYGGPTQKYVGEKKIRFADYRRWMGL